jgi:hypothetical protein
MFRVLVFVVALLASSSVRADIITFQDDGSYSSLDSVIRSGQPTMNFGARPDMIVGKTTAPDRIRSVFGYDLSAIPAGATINSVQFRLTAVSTDATSTAGVVTLELLQLTSPFTEGTGNSSGEANVHVSWDNRTTLTPWTTGGGDLGALLSSATANPNLAAGTAVNFGTSASFVSAIQAVVDGDGMFYFAVKGDSTVESENTRRIFFFGGGEHGTLDRRPLLTIDYTAPVPEPGTLVILGAIAACGLIVMRRRIG